MLLPRHALSWALAAHAQVQTLLTLAAVCALRSGCWRRLPSPTPSTAAAAHMSAWACSRGGTLPASLRSTSICSWLSGG